jgi:hypothetical protein
VGKSSLAHQYEKPLFGAFLIGYKYTICPLFKRCHTRQYLIRQLEFNVYAGSKASYVVSAHIVGTTCSHRLQAFLMSPIEHQLLHSGLTSHSGQIFF